MVQSEQHVIYRLKAGRPKITWKKLMEKDCREWKLTTVDPQERNTWRSCVRSAMPAASQLPARGPNDADDAPAPDPHERSTWRSGVRSAMRAASQLPGKGPTDVDDAPAPACSSKIRL